MITEPTTEYMHVTGRWWELDTVTEVDHAVGMIATQLTCSLQDAATIIRAHAAAHSQHPVDVAIDIVDRKLSFNPY